MKKNGITEYYEEIETIEEYDGYFCSWSNVNKVDRKKLRTK